MAIPANIAEEALRTLKLLDRAVTRISEYEFPRLIANVPEEFDEDDEEYDDDACVTFTCPWCRRDLAEDDIVAVDNGQRTTYARELNDNDQTTLYFDYGDGEDDGFQTLYLKCDHCSKPVSLPVGWDRDSY